MAVLPCSESTTCLFRTRPLDASDTLVFNEVFSVSMSYPALHQKTLRVDVCTTDQSRLEDCLVRAMSVRPSICLSTQTSVLLRIGPPALWEGGLEKTQIAGLVSVLCGPRQRLFQRHLAGWRSSLHGRRSNRPESVF